MGIRGLLLFVKKCPDVRIQNETLSNCNLVIDGGNFVHHLFHKSNANSDIGGDYDVYANYVRKVFRVFKNANITPLFVFDGPKDWNGPKLEEQKRRLNERLNKVNNICNDIYNRNNGPLPICTYEVFTACMQEFQFASITITEGDADEHMAGLANQLQCPIMSNDADFLIFDLPGGVLVTDWIDFDDCIRRNHFNCRIYRSSKSFLRCDLLPLAASLIGNDYMKLSAHELSRFDFLAKSPAPYHVIPQIRKMTQQKLDDLKDRIMKSNHSDELKNSLCHYELRKTLQLTAEGEMIFAKKLKQPISADLLYGRKHVFFIDILMFGKVMLPTPIELHSLCSVHDACRNWRQIAYSIVVEQHSLLSKWKTVQELDRNGSSSEFIDLELQHHDCYGNESWQFLLHAVGADDDPLINSQNSDLNTNSPVSKGRRFFVYILAFARRQLRSQMQQLNQQEPFHDLISAAAKAQILTFSAFCLASSQRDQIKSSMCKIAHKMDVKDHKFKMHFVHFYNLLQSCMLSAMLLIQAHDAELELPSFDQLFPAKLLFNVSAAFAEASRKYAINSNNNANNSLQILRDALESKELKDVIKFVISE